MRELLRRQTQAVFAAAPKLPARNLARRNIARPLPPTRSSATTIESLALPKGTRTRWSREVPLQKTKTQELASERREAIGSCYNNRYSHMAIFRVQTPQRDYNAVVERGVLARLAEFVPLKAGKIFVVTT